MIKAVIFDHTALLCGYNRNPVLHQALLSLVDILIQRGLKICVLATHHITLELDLRSAGFRYDAVVQRIDVGISKGSPMWMYTAAQKLGIKPHEMCYIGDDDLDWRTAINTPVFYFHAEWANPYTGGATALAVKEPVQAYKYISHLLLVPPRWQYKIDEPNLIMRSLLNCNTKLAASTQSEFSLQTVLKYERTVMVHDTNAVELLILHAMSSLYLEGRVSANSLFTVYPSSKTGKRNPVLEIFLKNVAKFFKGYYVDDLIIRTHDTFDTSLERKQERRHNATFLVQANSVCLNQKWKDRISGSKVVIFDDFTTEGFALEWSRNLLQSAGALQTILLTIGKYPRPYQMHTPINSQTIYPFEEHSYSPTDFKVTARPITSHGASADLTSKSFQFWRDNQPFE